ncbi:MAG: AraD1 family protein [Bacteroidota bacterium]
MNNIRLVQLLHSKHGRRVALVKEPSLILLKEIRSVYDLALKAIHTRAKIEDFINSGLSDEKLEYSPIYEGKSEWKLLPSFDHPGGPFGCIISGTGLTHKNSALNRQMMHGDGADKLTDSIKMYQMGVEGGFPEKGKIGVQPEWFYKGNGFSLKAHGQPLEVPSYANDGGEEPELAGIYVIDEEGQPWRIGFTTGNEFSDHIMEKKNYLYLAPSKLRQCAIGPELVIDNNFDSFEGTVNISRKEELVWSANIKSGEKNMSHSLENIEHHQFKYKSHRIPLQAHIHFYGADAFSFGSGIKLQDGDLMNIMWNGMGRALQNPIKIITEEEKLMKVRSF